MSENNFSLTTDKSNKCKVTSSLIYVQWTASRAHAGLYAGFELRTILVGNGAPVKLVCKTAKGKKIAKTDGVIYNNFYCGEILIPDNCKINEYIVLEAELPKHGLSDESNSIPVGPCIKVSSMKWDRQKVKRGEEVKINCTFTDGVEEGDGATVKIYEKGSEESPGIEMASIRTEIKNKKIDIVWKFNYQDDVSLIPTEEELSKYNKHYFAPSLYFTVEIDGVPIGKNCESGLMVFYDDIDVKFNGCQMKEREYTLYLPDGNKKSAKLDNEGSLHEKDIPPGPVKFKLGGEDLVTLPVPQSFEIGDTHFHFNATVFLSNNNGKHKENNEYVHHSSGIVLIERILRQLELSDQMLLITGHTDSVGSDSANIELSLLRAKSVYSILTGDRELFKTVADAPHIASQEKKLSILQKSKMQIADWAASTLGWTCSQKMNNYNSIETIRSFQKNYNNHEFAQNPAGVKIDEDGDWGPNTWGAVFDCYELEICSRFMIDRKNLDKFRQKIDVKNRFLFPDKPYAGCGEYHPIDSPGNDNFESASNRRVEVLLFSKGEKPSVACVSGTCDGRMCKLYMPYSEVRGRKLRVEWQNPELLALHCQKRNLKVEYNGFKNGSIVNFEIYQLLRDNECTPLGLSLSATVVNGTAEAQFEEASNDTVKSAIPENYGMKISYFFTAEQNGLMVVSSRLPSDGDNPIYN